MRPKVHGQGDLVGTVRIGVEIAGHYRGTMVARMVGVGHEIAESVGISQMQVSRILRSALASIRDELSDDPMVRKRFINEAAIVDLIVSIVGRAPQQRTDALVEQVAWAGCRRRIVARTAFVHLTAGNVGQLLGTLDLISGQPALMTCSSPTLTGRAGVISRHRREATTQPPGEGTRHRPRRV